MYNPLYKTTNRVFEHCSHDFHARSILNIAKAMSINDGPAKKDITRTFGGPKEPVGPIDLKIYPTWN